MKVLSIIIFIAIFFICCKTCTRWTEKQKEEFESTCSITDTVNGINFYFTGFPFNEIEDILVRQIHNGSTVDSFWIHPVESTFDSIRTRYSASIDKHLFVKDTFQFITKGDDKFFLSEMKMIKWPHFTMFSEGYGCVMGDYKINGVRFKGSANPDFIKKGFKFPWDK